MRPLGPALAFLLLGAAPLASQAVRGTLVAAPGGEPVPAALVVLLDASGRTLDSDQSDAAGRFDLRAAGPGEFRVRAERVGYATAAPTPVTLAAGQTLELRLETAAAASVLEGLVVQAPERKCVVDPREGARTAALWEEARKSLELAEHSRQRGAFRFTLRRFRRNLEPGSGVVRGQTADTTTALSVTPYASLPAADLAANGYVRSADGGSVFYGPDAPVLLSDEFLDSHCFRVQPGQGAEAGLVGLAFEPTRGRRLPDVRGVLWLDPATAELRGLGFQYTGLRGELDVPGEWGGRLEFERLPDGAVIVRRWSLRMPVVGRTPAPGGSLHAPQRLSVAAVREEGAEVMSVALASGQVARAGAAASVRGEVFDSTRGVPLAGAAVRLAGTPHTATTDAAGRFVLAGVPEGRYALAFAHPRLDSLAYVPEPVQVAVGAAGETAASLAIPRGAAPRPAAPVAPAAGGAAPAAGDTAAVRLEGITVTASAAARVLRFRGFYERQRAAGGSGAFLDAQAIERMRRGRVVDVINGLRGVSGMPVSRDTRTSSSAARAYTARRFGARCVLPVWLDGIVVPGSDLDRLKPDQLAGIEVYVGAETPPRFNPRQAVGQICGAIVVWTKGGEK